MTSDCIGKKSGAVVLLDHCLFYLTCKMFFKLLYSITTVYKYREARVLEQAYLSITFFFTFSFLKKMRIEKSMSTFTTKVHSFQLSQCILNIKKVKRLWNIKNFSLICVSMVTDNALSV